MIETSTLEACEALGVDFHARARENINGRWFTHDRLATLEDFEKHWRGEKVIGHVTKNFVNVVSIDLDVHGLLPGIAEEVLSEKYDVVCKTFGRPALVNRTREGGGLHCYWWLSRPLSFETLRARIKDRFPGVEVLPSPRRRGSEGKILRTPGAYACGGHFLSPDDLSPLPISPGEETPKAISEAAEFRVSLEGFLGTSKDVVREILKGGSVRRIHRGLQLVGKLETASGEIRRGNTNEAILSMVRSTVSAGFSGPETFVFIRDALKASGVLLKDDTQGEKLEERVRILHASCRKEKVFEANKLLTPSGDTFFVDPTARKIVEMVRAEFHVDVRRMATLERVSRSLVRAIARIDSLTTQKRRVIDSVYPGFFKRVEKGLYPLPRNLWRSWAINYSWYRQALMSLGIISPGWDTTRGEHAGYIPAGRGNGHYRNREEGFGICRYYKAKLPF